MINGHHLDRQHMHIIHQAPRRQPISLSRRCFLPLSPVLVAPEAHCGQPNRQHRAQLAGPVVVLLEGLVPRSKVLNILLKLITLQV